MKIFATYTKEQKFKIATALNIHGRIRKSGTKSVQLISVSIYAVLTSLLTGNRL